MKNSKPVVIFSLVALLLCVVGGYIFITIDANSKLRHLTKDEKYKYILHEANNQNRQKWSTAAAADHFYIL